MNETHTIELSVCDLANIYLSIYLLAAELEKNGEKDEVIHQLAGLSARFIYSLSTEALEKVLDIIDDSSLPAQLIRMELNYR